MTRDDFVAKYRPRLLLFIAEAWAVRREDTRTLGLVMDNHHRELRQLLAELWSDFNPEPQKVPAVNGRATR